MAEVVLTGELARIVRTYFEYGYYSGFLAGAVLVGVVASLVRAGLVSKTTGYLVAGGLFLLAMAPVANGYACETVGCPEDVFYPARVSIDLSALAVSWNANTAGCAGCSTRANWLLAAGGLLLVGAAITWPIADRR